uniref:CLK4-associating serine/arginine rich protein-like isoform X2 n=1 Tax=Erigeron canadensis TaxID=72917 RepID=UPI001CB893B2|nr:CLK4-associating serine/arginine rich protein-like isoform X2 [Erigeron canadensis]
MAVPVLTDLSQARSKDFFGFRIILLLHLAICLMQISIGENTAKFWCGYDVNGVAIAGSCYFQVGELTSDDFKGFKEMMIERSSSGLAKLSKPSGSRILAKQQGEKKETPQEQLKRIMNKQLNKQIKKDNAAEMAKKREQKRHRLEKLAETSRLSFRLSRSPPRSVTSLRSRSISRSRSPRLGS